MTPDSMLSLKPKRRNGQVVDPGGKLEVTLLWKDAPAFYIDECQDKLDKYDQPPDQEAFFEMFDIVKVTAIPL